MSITRACPGQWPSAGVGHPGVSDLTAGIFLPRASWWPVCSNRMLVGSPAHGWHTTRCFAGRWSRISTSMACRGCG